MSTGDTSRRWRRFYEQIANQRVNFAHPEPGEPQHHDRTGSNPAACGGFRIRQRCPEDIGVLEERIRNWIAAR